MSDKIYAAVYDGSNAEQVADAIPCLELLASSDTRDDMPAVYEIRGRRNECCQTIGVGSTVTQCGGECCIRPAGEDVFLFDLPDWNPEQDDEVKRNIAEAARVLGMTISTVRRHAERAIREAAE